MKCEFDVVIIGSGVAGALCAAGLAAPGRKILILEAAENGLGVAQREQFRRSWDPVPAKSWNTPYNFGTGINFYRSPSGDVGPGRYFDQSPTGDDEQKSLTTFKGTYQRLAGGSTWAWRGNTPRMMPNDLRLKTEYFKDVEPKNHPDGAAIANWPLSYDDMKPWYLRAERELGVSGNAEEWEKLSPRDGVPYPMPAQPRSYGDGKLIELAQRNGPIKVVLGSKQNATPLTVQFLTMAQARNTQPYDGRPACEGNHNCIPLCPTNAKYDATVHLKRALQKGVQLETGCVVTRLEAGANGLIEKVCYINWKQDPKKEVTVTGKTVILAANPVESAKILLHSGLYTGADHQVGKNLMDHIQYEALAVAPVDIFPFRGPQTLTGIDSLRDGKYRKEFASFRITLGNDGWGREGNPTSVVEELTNPAQGGEFFIGKALREKAVKQLVRLVRLSVSAEQLPHPSNQVTLSNERDDLGIPRPKITYAVHPYTLEALQQGFGVCKTIFGAMDAHVHNDFKRKDWKTAAHPMGTCRMGTNRSNSVVDKYGRCHNHRNLFIVGASVFPTSSATNPLLTIAALTLMTVNHINHKS